jgi:hypothetical protein
MDDHETTVWERRDVFARYQQQRVLAITLGGIFLELARAWIWNTSVDGQPNLRRARRAASLLLRAADQYAAAGMRRKARAVWRYAQLLHAAASRAGV